MPSVIKTQRGQQMGRLVNIIRLSMALPFILAGAILWGIGMLIGGPGCVDAMIEGIEDALRELRETSK